MFSKEGKVYHNSIYILKSKPLTHHNPELLDLPPLPKCWGCKCVLTDRASDPLSGKSQLDLELRSQLL